jgi:glucose-1-phosphate thymidylyltransferase
MKGIVLAGGTGSRLWPITHVTSKQLLPLYDKPMIYYPISTLMLAGIQDILIVTSPSELKDFKILLGDGSQFGVNFSYAVQPTPDGLAQALLIGREFINGEGTVLILGDNIFHGAGLGHDLSRKFPKRGSHIFTYEVSNPSAYGILTLDDEGKPSSIEEKPKISESNLAVTGMYYFDERASGIASKVKPSARGELEITSVIGEYLNSGELTFTHLSRGTAWLDTGTIESMHDAATYVRVLEERTGLKIACLEEIGLQNNWISKESILDLIKSKKNCAYTDYLKKLV